MPNSDPYNPDAAAEIETHQTNLLSHSFGEPRK